MAAIFSTFSLILDQGVYQVEKMIIIKEQKMNSYEDLIQEEDIIVSLTKDGYIKRVPLDTFKIQNRGGKGVIGVKSREEDEASDRKP